MLTQILEPPPDGVQEHAANFKQTLEFVDYTPPSLYRPDAQSSL